nr:glycosyltransferase [Plastoroseomonas arctica]
MLSSYWNGAATYYRGVIRDLAARGHDVIFYEPEAYDRQAHNDIAPPDWARSRVYAATTDALNAVMDEAALADVVVKTSGVGVFDDELITGVMSRARPDAVRIFWDVDAPATLEEIRPQPGHPLRQALPALDLVLTYGGGPPVVAAYESLGARRCVPIYNALDPDTHHPVPPEPRFAADLSLLANRLPDRERRVEAFFLDAALRLPGQRFVLGGNGWADKPMSPNIRYIGHVPTRDHNAFNTSATAVLNIARDSMAATGYSPATRVFEAAGAGACLITDAWVGLELFLAEGIEVLVARDGADVAAHVAELTPARARAIGEAARLRICADHTYTRRGVEVDALLREETARRRAMVANA